MKTTLKLIFIFFSTGLCAQQQLRLEPVFRNYGTDQGLPSNWVYDIIQDSKGYIWISTNNGVCRFNGYEFEQFPDTLQSNYTAVLGRCMIEDEAGRIWFVDFQKRVFYVENDRIIPWKYNDRLAVLSRSVNLYLGLVVKGRGEEIWLGSTSSGIVHADNTGNCVLLPFPDAADRFLFENEHGWLVSAPLGNYDKYYLNKTQTININENAVRIPLFTFTPDSLFDYNWRFFSINRLSDRSWLVNLFGAYYCIKQGRLLWYRKASGKATIWAVEDVAGRVFTGHHYGGGLKMYHTSQDFRDDKPALSLLPGLTVSCILQDHEGGYWIGTQERGVFYCVSFENGQLTGLAGLQESVVKGVVWDAESTLYAGLFNGKVFAIDLRNLIARDISIPEIRLIHDLFYDKNSETLGLSGSNNRFYKNAAWNLPNAFEPVSGKIVPWSGVKLSPTHEPDVWLSASGFGLARVNIRTKKVEQSTYSMWSGKGAYHPSTCIREDQSGRIWASGQDGLVEWVGDRAIPADTTYPAFRQNIRDIDLLPDTSLILSPKGHGVVIWKPGHLPVEINSRQGLLSDQVFSLYYHAPDSTIWACNNRGVNKLSPDGSGGYRIESFTVKHGLPSNTVNAVAVAGNDVWLATDKGLYCMRDRPGATSIPAPLFASVQVGNTPYFPPGMLSLPHDSSDVSIEFVSLHFRSNGQIPYAYRLLHSSGDNSWMQGLSRRISFPNLLPGKYRLEVKAQSEAGIWSPVSALDILIRPPWYNTWWAYSLAVMAFGLLVFGIYRYRTNQIRNEGRLKEEMFRLERSALQAQMNPHFIFNCLNSIQHFILKNESDAAVMYLAKFAKLVRNNLNASVAGEISLEEEIQLLDNYLALEQLRFRQVFDYQIEVDEQLDRSNTLLPPLIVQPFVENAVLHGMKEMQKDGRIRITFQEEDGYLRIHVQDNGTGMGTQATASGKTSLGRSIIRRRLEIMQQQNIQKDISIQYLIPEDGTGTCVSIKLLLSCKAKLTEL